VFFRPGVLPNDPSKPRLKLKRFLTGDLPVIPAAVDYDKAVPATGRRTAMTGMGTASSPCSVMSSRPGRPTGQRLVSHHQGRSPGLQRRDGFDPEDPSTDNGTVVQDALSWWRKTGMAGHKILAFAQVDHTSPAEMEAAAALFGEVLLAINFPNSAMTQFNAGKPWDVVRNDGGIEGGHAICSARYDADKKAVDGHHVGQGAAGHLRLPG
jgi:hypothetical protein